MERIKIIYVISTVDFSYGMKWLAMHMPQDKYDITFVFLYHKVPSLHNYLLDRNIKSVYIPYNSKYQLPKVIFKLIGLFLRIKPHIVHAHLFEASLAGLIAACLSRVPIRIHTRHHASLHHDSYKHAVKYDRFINRMSHKIIAISENVKSILVDLDRVAANKVALVHHGFDFNEFQINTQEIERLRLKYNLGNHHPVIGVISRFTHFKGIQYIIPAFRNLLNRYPDAVLVLANAIGDYKDVILQMLDELPPHSYRVIEFEQSVFSLYGCFDVFVHTPINAQVEAFGQIYIEAMAMKIPVVCTLSGIAYEFIVDNKNALVVDFSDSNAITERIVEVLNNNSLKQLILSKAQTDIKELFDVALMINKLESIYKSQLNYAGYK